MDRVVPEIGLAEIMSQIKVVGKFLLAVSLLWFVVVLVWAAGLAGKAFPTVGNSPLLGWILLGLAAWGSMKGADACAACSGVLCLFLLALYGTVAVFSIGDVRMEYLRLNGEPEDAIRCIGLLLTASAVWYLPSNRSRKKRMWDIAVILLAGATLLAAITGGVLSPELAAEAQVPLYAVAQSVSLFGVVERIEPLLSAAMTMGIFALLSAMANVCKTIGNQIRPWKYYDGLACAAAAIMLLVVKKIDTLWLAAGGGIVCVLLPVLVIAAGKRKNNY